MAKDTLKIIITGHVDHGKSTLIGRLLLDTNSLPKEKVAEIKHISQELGKDTELAFLVDQLKEERENSLTIDTTQIFFHSRRRNYVIIDAPGHAEFIKNMFTGATQAQAAVLLIDMREGIKDQTRRHPYILGMLGIENVIVACNKMDLVGFERNKFEEIKEQIAKILNSIGIAPKYIIPISARMGLNISKKSRETPWYKGPTLLGALDSIKPVVKTEDKPLRLAIQDIYEINGEKIVAGKVLSGKIQQGQHVRIYPQDADARIWAIRVFLGTKKKAQEGENIGLILDNPSVARRGEIISQKEHPPHLTSRFKADIFWMAEEPLKLNSPIILRCSTQEVNCVAEKIEERINSSTLEIIEENAGELRFNEAGVVVLKTEKPIAIEKFDFVEELGRFVIETDDYLQAAGIITRP